MFKSLYTICKRCYRLAAPYGKRKTAYVMALILFNGVMQVVGVVSVLPFFAIAADPDRVESGRVGGRILNWLPDVMRDNLLLSAGLTAIVLLLSASASAFAVEVSRNRYAHGLAHHLRVCMMDALANRPYEYFVRRNSGAVIRKLLADIAQFTSTVFVPLLDGIAAAVTALFLLFTVFVVNPGIAIGAGFFFGVFYGTTFLLLRRRSKALGGELKKTNKGTFITAVQFLGGVKPIFTRDCAGYFIDRFRGYSRDQARLSPWVNIYSNAPRYFIEPIAFGGLVAVVLWFVVQGKPFISILPELTILAAAGYRLLPAIQKLFARVNQINAMSYLIGEIEVEMEEFTEKEKGGVGEIAANRGSGEHRLPFKRSILIDNITFAYPTANRPVLSDFSLEIPINSSVGIIGTTGCGKTTLVDLIIGLYQPQKGRILVDNHSLTSEDRSAWRGMIGYVPQDIYLFDASIAENIALGVSVEMIDWESLSRAAKLAQIFEFVENELPDRWETQVGERGVRLSGGQMQRVGLARALYHDPDILILDEATSALDTETESQVMEAIQRLKGKITMIVIAHRLTTVEKCDATVQLHGLGGAKPAAGGIV